MNTSGLAKLYGHLTARERLPLIMAAAVRGDEAERRRLVQSAPKIGFQVPDYFGLGSALAEAANLYLLTLLDLAAHFWQCWGLWLAPWGRAETGKDSGSAKAEDDEHREFRLYCMVRYHAYRFVVHVDAWEQFCSELKIDPDAGLDFMPGWDMITRTGAKARELAFSREEATMFLLGEAVEREGDEAEETILPEVETAEGLAKAWHTIIAEREKWLAGKSHP